MATRTSLLSVVVFAWVAGAAAACGGDDSDTVAPAPDGSADVDPSAEPPAGGKGDAGANDRVFDVDCPLGAAVELEPNDEPADATELYGTQMCGALSPGTDVDYSAFTTPPGKKLALFQAVIDGKVAFELRVNDKTLKPSDVKDFEAGEYLVKAFTTDGEPGKYRYRIQFEP